MWCTRHKNLIMNFKYQKTWRSFHKLMAAAHPTSPQWQCQKQQLHPFVISAKSPTSELCNATAAVLPLQRGIRKGGREGLETLCDSVANILRFFLSLTLAKFGKLNLSQEFFNSWSSLFLLSNNIICSCIKLPTCPRTICGERKCLYLPFTSYNFGNLRMPRGTLVGSFISPSPLENYQMDLATAVAAVVIARCAS